MASPSRLRVRATGHCRHGGRLHNKEALVKELAKIDKIVRARVPHAAYRKVLVLDATTGQNSLAQAEVFHAAVGVDSIVLSKCDSTAKAACSFPSAASLRFPFPILEWAKKLDDLEVFQPLAYLDSLFGAP